MAPEQREKEEAARVTRQRPVIRVCAELALVGVIRDAPLRSGGEWIMKILRDLVRSFPDTYALSLMVDSCPTILPWHLCLSSPRFSNHTYTLSLALLRLPLRSRYQPQRSLACSRRI